MSGSEKASAAVADAPPGNWVDAYAPEALKPYLRMARADRPIGGWLLALPGLQGLALAGSEAGWRLDRLTVGSVGEILWLFAAFFIGAFVMRGAGCVLNDVVDRDIDAQVERTRSRPLPSGQASLAGALILLALLTAVGLAILATFNWTAIAVGLSSAVFVLIYPFMKRVTWWPQLFLGLAFGWGALLADAALAGAVSLANALLYAAAIAWIIGYDTIYAHQDREDDALIGVKSTARLFGDRTARALWILYGLAVALAGAAGAVAGLGLLFWIGLGGFAMHLVGQIRRLDINDAALCNHLFRSNREAGLLLLVGLLFGWVGLF